MVIRRTCDAKELGPGFRRDEREKGFSWSRLKNLHNPLRRAADDGALVGLDDGAFDQDRLGDGGRQDGFIVGSTPCSRSSARALRDVPHFGLWKMTRVIQGSLRRR
jgi:hypothetical protein